MLGLLLCVLYCIASYQCLSWTIHGSCKKSFYHASKPHYSTPSDDSDETSALALFKESIEYVDLTAASNENKSPNVRPLPLFLLTGSFYPSGTTYLNVFEMKYRTMMFDVAKSDDMFGYIHTNSRTGQIASIGTVCKIVDRELIEDGRQVIGLEGVGRFKVNKILSTLPYVLAEVETEIIDEEVENVDEAIRLEIATYRALKYYIRLIKSYESNQDVVVTTGTKNCRPAGPNSLTDPIRRTSFSFALANMIQMTQPRESQLLLQTRSVTKRLEVEKEVLEQASELIAEQLIKMSILTAEKRNHLKEMTYSEDNDDDIMPSMEGPEVDAVEEKDEWDLSNIV